MSTTTLGQATSDQQEVTMTVTTERATGNWCAYTPDDVGVVVVTGPTREETIEKFRAALRSHFRVMRDEVLSVSNVTQLEIRETLAA